MRHPPADCPRPDGAGDATGVNVTAERDCADDALFVIGGFNGLKSIEAWVTELRFRSRNRSAHAYSWRAADCAKRDIVAQSRKTRVTLVGHSLGGGYAQLLSQQLPAGTVSTLITVAPYGPKGIDCDLTRRNVGRWLNILPTSGRWGWRDLARNMAAPLLLNWREQGFIASASENHLSEFPHHDFYGLMADRAGR